MNNLRVDIIDKLSNILKADLNLLKSNENPLKFIKYIYMNLYGVSMWGDHYIMIPYIISLLTLVTKNIKKPFKNQK